MNAGDKNWLFVKIITDEGIHGWGEGSLEGQEKTVEKTQNQLGHFAFNLSR